MLLSAFLYPLIQKLYVLLLPLISVASDLRLESTGVEELDKLLINTLFKVAFNFFGLLSYFVPPWPGSLLI